MLIAMTKTVLLNMILLSHKCLIISNIYFFFYVYKLIASAAWQLYSVFASVVRMKAGDRTNPQVPVVVWLVMINVNSISHLISTLFC